MALFFRKYGAGMILLLLAMMVCLASCASTDGSSGATGTVTAEDPEASSGSLRVTVLDVGKGDCIVIDRDGSFVMIDAGYEESAEKALSFLRRSGADHLDCLIVTHYDKDHVGGARKIVERFPVRQVWLPGYEGENKYYGALMYSLQTRSVAADQVTEDVSFTLAGMDFRLFASPLEYVHEEGRDEGNDNDMSVVVSLRFGMDSYLFSGDIEKAGINAFLSAGRGTFDVVKMPHHGRKKGNTDDFIDSTQPKIALITDSADEPANEKVISLLLSAGAEIYCSSDCSDITVTSAGEGIYSVRTEIAPAGPPAADEP